METSPEVESKREKNRFERHPRLTLIAFVSLLVVGLDLVAGLLFIRPGSGFRIPHPYYHHALRPNARGLPEWGYYAAQSVSTNSLGFRDLDVREVPLASPRRRIVLMGDSFVEGLRVAYDRTFAGRLQRELEGDQVEVLDAGVSSYSPKLYYLKTRYLIEEVGLKLDELYVFVDISDAQDEMIYKDFKPVGEGGRGELWRFRLKELLFRRSYLYNSVSRLLERARGTATYINYEGGFFRFLSDEALAILRDPGFQRHRQMWTLEPDVYEAWARRGLGFGASNLQELFDLCQAHHIRMTVVVYPWPAQILAGDRDSIQVRFWRSFCEARNIRFVDLFPAFVPGSRAEAEEVVHRYFLEGDVHWNESGHELVEQQLLLRMR